MPLANDLIMSGRSIGFLDTLNVKIHLLFRFYKLSKIWQSLVPILATRALVVPLANDTIMSGRLRQSFRHLKHQNLSTGDDFFHNNSIILLVQFLAIKKALVQLTNDPILSRRLMVSFLCPC